MHRGRGYHLQALFQFGLAAHLQIWLPVGKTTQKTSFFTAKPFSFNAGNIKESLVFASLSFYCQYYLLMTMKEALLSIQAGLNRVLKDDDDWATIQ